MIIYFDENLLVRWNISMIIIIYFIQIVWMWKYNDWLVVAVVAKLEAAGLREVCKWWDGNVCLASHPNTFAKETMDFGTEQISYLDSGLEIRYATIRRCWDYGEKAAMIIGSSRSVQLSRLYEYKRKNGTTPQLGCLKPGILGNCWTSHQWNMLWSWWWLEFLFNNNNNNYGLLWAINLDKQLSPVKVM